MDISKLLIQAANLSISAGWLVLAVLLARLLLKKAPRWAHVTLWGIVGLRLVLPLTWESALSLLPSRETIPQEIVTSPSPGIQSGVPMLDSFVNPVLQQQFTPNPGDSVNPLQVWLFVGAVVWLVGMGLLLGYTLFTYIRLRRRVATAVWLEENVYQSEFVASPFVLGLLRARIYLPYGLAGEAMAHVLAHEQAHLRRKDHWWKPLGFLLLTIYWFNPLLWVAYVLLCRDIELACDEKVVKKLDTQQRADYSQALLSCSVSRRSIAACPLAFGEVGVKQRIKSVLHYKKPAFWLVLVAVIACIALAVGFLTAPKPEQNFDPPAQTDPSASTNHPVQTDPPYQTNPPVQPVDNLTWAQILKPEDVVSIYVERTFDSDFYADSAQIQRIVEILNQVEGVYRQDGQENDGG